MPDCPGGRYWGPANHTYFQLANMFLAFSYLVPNTMKGLFILRIVLGTAGFFFAMWAGIILCSPDTLGWNFAFSVINFGHVGYLLWTQRAISFGEEHEVCYENIFEMLGVARWQYKVLAAIGKATDMPKGQVYATEDSTDGTDISIVIHGSCKVSKNGKMITRVKPYEFLDSPEWIVSTQGGGAFPVTFEVSIESEGCVIMTWNRSALVKVLRRQPFLKHIFDSIIGQDVAKKIFSQNKAMFTEPGMPGESTMCATRPDSQRFEPSLRMPTKPYSHKGSLEHVNGGIGEKAIPISPLVSSNESEKKDLINAGDDVQISVETQDERNTNV